MQRNDQTLTDHRALGIWQAQCPPLPVKLIDRFPPLAQHPAMAPLLASLICLMGA